MSEARISSALEISTFTSRTIGASWAKPLEVFQVFLKAVRTDGDPVPGLFFGLPSRRSVKPVDSRTDLLPLPDAKAKFHSAKIARNNIEIGRFRGLFTTTRTRPLST